jgi:hypothetical protein
MCRFFKLEGKTAFPVEYTEHIEWIIQDPDHGARKVQTDWYLSGTDEILVSTTFLMGINYRWMDGAEPLLFETMVLGGTMDQAQWRYSTWEQAETGHQEVLDQLLREMPHLVKKVEPPRERVPTRHERIIRDLGLLGNNGLHERES